MGISGPSGCALCREHRALVPGLAVTAPGVCSTQGPHGQGDPRASLCKGTGALANALEQYLQTDVQEHLCFTAQELFFPWVAQMWLSLVTWARCT